MLQRVADLQQHTGNKKQQFNTPTFLIGNTTTTDLQYNTIVLSLPHTLTLVVESEVVVLAAGGGAWSLPWLQAREESQSQSPCHPSGDSACGPAILSTEQHKDSDALLATWAFKQLGKGFE